MNGKKRSEIKRFLFTGTIAEETGIFECLGLIRKIHAIKPHITLRIVGHCTRKSIFKRLIETTKELPYVTVVGGKKLVPYDIIIEEIFKADVGIICYPYKKHIQGKLPTKLYEYLGYKLPFIIEQRDEWVEICEKHNAAISLSKFSTANVHELLKALATKSFYGTNTNNDVYWESYQSQFQNTVLDLARE